MMAIPPPWALQGQRPSCCGPWTVALVISLLWPASPICCLNVSSFDSAEHDSSRPSTATRRCSPASSDVLWTRLTLTARRASLQDVDEVDRTHSSPVASSAPADKRQSSLGDISRKVASERRQNHRRRRRRWRERGEQHRRRRAKHTSWSCRMKKRWKRMPRDVFPSYIQKGSCDRQPTCMLGMYSCRPRRYLIKVLRRVSVGDSDDSCRPVPVVGPTVVYEEAWMLVDVPVTVACECSRRRRSGIYHSRPNDDT